MNKELMTSVYGENCNGKHFRREYYSRRNENFEHNILTDYSNHISLPTQRLRLTERPRDGLRTLV